MTENFCIYVFVLFHQIMMVSLSDKRKRNVVFCKQCLQSMKYLGMRQFCWQKNWKNRLAKAKSKMLAK